MGSDTREVQIKIDMPGTVPVTSLADKLNAAQRAIWNIGAAIHGSGGRRGGWSAKVLEACTLGFVGADVGCLQITAKLPERDETWIPGFELGESALTCLGQTLEAVGNTDRNALHRLFPDHGQRTRVMTSLTPLFPEEDAQYDVVVTAGRSACRLRPEGRRSVVTLVKEEPEEIQEMTTTVTGKLYLIEVETGARQIGVIAENRQIPCFYPSEYEDLVKDLIPGTLVEVDGRALLNDNGTVKQIAEVFDVRMVQLIPLRWMRVDYANRRFKLKEPIYVVQGFSEGVWTHECSQLGILEYGESRCESINAFRMDFAATWDLIVDESDERLTREAQELKKRFLAVVETEEDLS